MHGPCWGKSSFGVTPSFTFWGKKLEMIDRKGEADNTKFLDDNRERSGTRRTASRLFIAFLKKGGGGGRQEKGTKNLLEAKSERRGDSDHSSHLS